MAVSSRQNQNMMNLIRKVHGLVERPDLTKEERKLREAAKRRAQVCISIAEANQK